MRNKKEELLMSLEHDTIAGKILWQQIPSSSYSTYIFNSAKSVRIFETEIKGKKLLVVEQKMPSYIHDLDDYYDVSSLMLYILAGDSIELTVVESEVSNDLLNKLLAAILNKQEKDIIDELLE